jgi:hypothetical protein
MRADISQRTTNQQRLFLPVFLKEGFWGEPPSNVIGFMAVSRACEPFYGLQYVQAAVPHHSLQEREFLCSLPCQDFSFHPGQFLMQIAKDTVVTLHYEMFDAENNLLDKTEEPIAYLHGGYDGIFPLVEEALHGKNVGDSVDVKLTRMMLSATRKKNWFALKTWTCSRLTWKSA